ncbi:MAG TPA: hypothetical protein VIV60_02440, partial [Polyangiaceae bacterium]
DSSTGTAGGAPSSGGASANISSSSVGTSAGGATTGAVGNSSLPSTGGATGNSSVTATTGGTSSGGPSSVGGTRNTSEAPLAGGTKARGGSGNTPSGGVLASAGGNESAGRSAGVNRGGNVATGGNTTIGSSNTGVTGGTQSSGNTGGAATGGRSTSGSAGGGATSTSSTPSGTCTASKAAGTNASGTGPHKVTVETNSDAGVKEGTIFRPTDLGGDEKYPIFVWGEGGCSQNGLSNSAAMAEIASYGYFVIADGTPNNSASRSMDSSNPTAMGKPLLSYVTWAIAENEKSCSAYYHSLDTTKVASNGFSCGGLMAEGTAGDPRITTWGLNSSGLFAANQTFYKTIHTPVLIVLGGTDDMAYENGERDYDNISALGVPIMLFSKALGHGGDLFSKNGGDFTKIDLAWLNWWLKGDETATGKGRLVGSGCSYCTNSAWEVKSKNIP